MPFEKKLVAHTPEGINVQPLYRREDAVARLLRDHDVDVPVKTYGLPQEFLTHGTRDEVLEEAGLTSQQLALHITEAVARRSSAEAPQGTPEPRPVD